MPLYPGGLELVQWVREATPGTDAAATSRMFANSFNALPGDELFRPDVMRALLQRNRGYETAIKRWVKWTAEGEWSHQQGQHWLSMMVNNDAAPTGSNPYIWDGTVRNPAASPTLATFAIERQNTDGVTPFNQAFHYCFGQKLTLSFGDGEPLHWVGEGGGRRIQTETPTASLVLPAASLAPPPLARCWINDTWAALGTTQVTSQVLSATIEWSSGAVPLWTADGRTDLDFSVLGIDHRAVALDVRILCLVGPQTAIEKTAAEANPPTLRAVRLQFDGPAGAATESLRLDMMLKHEMGSVYEYTEHDGQKVVEYRMQESTDGTNLFAPQQTNAVATFI